MRHVVDGIGAIFTTALVFVLLGLNGCGGPVVPAVYCALGTAKACDDLRGHYDTVKPKP